MKPERIYYESQIINFELGRDLKVKFKDVPWYEIENHNNIPELRANSNTEFINMKKYLIIGTRKTHNYVDNQKISDFLVPYTSSGCSAMCLYCYLVCHYNKCSYLRLFVNREQMLDKLKKVAMQGDKEKTFEIGSNSDLVLENMITGNLVWTIENFAKQERGYITFPTKFRNVEPLLGLEHKGRTIARMSVNPQDIITKIEIGTSNLSSRLKAINDLCEDNYKVGLLIAPVVMVEGWKDLYSQMLDELKESLSAKMQKEMFIEIIFMTYSYVHRAINNQAFPDAVELYSQELMTGRGMGKYCYKQSYREDGEQFLRSEIEKRFDSPNIVYVV